MEKIRFRYTRRVLGHWRVCPYMHVGISGDIPLEIIPTGLRVYGDSLHAIACPSCIGYVLRPDDERLSLAPHVDLCMFTRVPRDEAELREGVYSFARGAEEVHNAYVVRIVHDDESALYEALLHLSHCKRMERPQEVGDGLRIQCPAYVITAYPSGTLGKQLSCVRTKRLHAPLYRTLKVMGFPHVEFEFSRIDYMNEAWVRLHNGLRLPSCT